MRTKEAIRVPQQRCPYCHEEIPKGEQPAVCRDCHALHHAECLSEHGACAACGSPAQTQAPTPQAAPPRPSRAADPARLDHDHIFHELREHFENKSVFLKYPWLLLLLPHTYVLPGLSWWIYWSWFKDHKQKCATFLNKLETTRQARGVKPSAAQQAVLDDVHTWCTTGVAPQTLWKDA